MGVYIKFKLNSDAENDINKVRLVAQGFTITQAISYNETFALVAKSNFVHVLLSLVATSSVGCEKCFLCVEIYMNRYVCLYLPGMYPHHNLRQLASRSKSIYSLKQFLHAWFDQSC